MYKAIGKCVEETYLVEKADRHIETIRELKEKFKKDGVFETFKHTSSYVEVPPISKTLNSGTYIHRQYNGVELVSLGATLYFVDCKELRKYMGSRPKFLRLGYSNLKVIRVDACHRYLNEAGIKFQREITKDWEALIKAVFSYSHY